MYHCDSVRLCTYLDSKYGYSYWPLNYQKSSSNNVLREKIGSFQVYEATDDRNKDGGAKLEWWKGKSRGLDCRE